MMFAPGKYDDLCTLVREKAGLTAGRGGGVMVIVLGGDKGNGFACQADPLVTLMIPEILDDVVRQMRKEDGHG
jgi:hypothetical protein